ncbi:MAG: hypothetical protein ACI8QC_000998 [Planctomycetota bacterium]|jgi:hypothetical protein
MHSWIFRNRDRLRLVYGALRSPEELLVDHATEPEPATLLPAPPGGAPQYACTGGPLGTVERLDDDVLLNPMPRMIG